MKGERGLLAEAIEREDWEAAALCLLLGVSEAALHLPPGAVEQMIEMLAEDVTPRRRRRRRRGLDEAR